MENSEHNVGRSRPVSEWDFVSAPRQLVPTPTVTRSVDASHAETTSSVVLRSHVRESRSSADKPEPESRPETELTAEIPAPTFVREEGFGATRPDTVADSVSVAMPRDKPEVVPTFPLPARQEIRNLNLICTPKPSSSYKFQWIWCRCDTEKCTSSIDLVRLLSSAANTSL